MRCESTPVHYPPPPHTHIYTSARTKNDVEACHQLIVNPHAAARARTPPLWPHDQRPLRRRVGVGYHLPADNADGSQLCVVCAFEVCAGVRCGDLMPFASKQC